jgi:DivIVA domain-containing protein
MSLLPADVRDTTFRVVRRGYATQEVDAFLSHLQLELSRLPVAPTGGAATGPGGDATPSGAAAPVPAGPDQALSVLRLAEQTAGQLLDRAREQAEQVVSSAHSTLRAELAGLERRRDQVRRELEELGALRLESRRALVALLEQQLRRARADGVLEAVPSPAA